MVFLGQAFRRAIFFCMYVNSYNRVSMRFPAKRPKIWPLGVETGRTETLGTKVKQLCRQHRIFWVGYQTTL